MMGVEQDLMKYMQDGQDIVVRDSDEEEPDKASPPGGKDELEQFMPTIGGPEGDIV